MWDKINVCRWGQVFCLWITGQCFQGQLKIFIFNAESDTTEWLNWTELNIYTKYPISTMVIHLRFNFINLEMYRKKNRCYYLRDRGHEAGKPAERVSHLVRVGLPWWFNSKEFPCQCRRHEFNPWSRKIPHATVQLNPCTTTTEPVL